MFMQLFIVAQSHCESLHGVFDEYGLSAGCPPTHRPSQSTWAVSPQKIGCYDPHSPSSFLVILGP